MFCCSSTICHFTLSLCVTLTLSLYLQLLVCNLFVAPMLFSCANTSQFSSFCVTLSRSLSLSHFLFITVTLSLSLLFHQFNLTLSLYYSQFRYEALLDLLFLMNLITIIKLQKLILSLMAYEKLNHPIFIHKVVTWQCALVSLIWFFYLSLSLYLSPSLFIVVLFLL